jgi:intracellular septation protein A
VLATCVAIAGGLAQMIYFRIMKGKQLGFMAYASLALTIVLAGSTLITNDPRFVLAKPSIAHFAIGAIMLKRGWMFRYVPPIVTETIPEYVAVAGYAWAALMFVDDLRDGGPRRREACRLRDPVCDVPYPGDPPPVRP